MFCSTFFKNEWKSTNIIFFTLSILKRMNGSNLLNRKRNETEETHSNQFKYKPK